MLICNYLRVLITRAFVASLRQYKRQVIVTAMDRMEEILEIVREIREDVSFMKHHRNMLCGMPILEVDEVCDLLKMSDRQLRRYRTSGQLVGFHFGRRLMFSTAEINRFIERVEMEHKQKKSLRKAIHNL